MQLFQIDPKDLTGHFDHIIASSAKVGESVRRLVIRTTIVTIKPVAPKPLKTK